MRLVSRMPRSFLGTSSSATPFLPAKLSTPGDVTSKLPSLKVCLWVVPNASYNSARTQEGLSQCFPIDVPSSGDAQFPFSSTTTLTVISVPHLILILIDKCPLPLPPPLLVYLLGEIKTQYSFTNVKDKRGNTGTIISKSPRIGYTNKTLFSLFLLHSWRKGIYIFFSWTSSKLYDLPVFLQLFFHVRK